MSNNSFSRGKKRKKEKDVLPNECRNNATVKLNKRSGKMSGGVRGYEKRKKGKDEKWQAKKEREEESRLQMRRRW